jgi:hypothetical protein
MQFAYLKTDPKFQIPIPKFQILSKSENPISETFRALWIVKSAYPWYQIVFTAKAQRKQRCFFLFFAIDPPKIPADRKDGKE